MNDEGVAMMEDCLFVSKEWLKNAKNEDKLVRFLRASLKGWKDACADTDAAADNRHEGRIERFDRSSEVHGRAGQEAR